MNQNIKQFHVLIAEDDTRLKRHETFSEARQEAVRLAGITNKTIFHLVAVEAIAKIKPLPRFFVAESEACKTEFTKRGILFLRADNENGHLLRVYAQGNSEFSVLNTLATAEVHVSLGEYREITKEEAEGLLKAATYPKYFATGDWDKTLVAYIANSPTDLGSWLNNDGSTEKSHCRPYAIEFAKEKGWPEITKEEAYALLPPKPQPAAPAGPKFPRFFTHKTGFRSDTAFVKYKSPSDGYRLLKDGGFEVIQGSEQEYANALEFVEEGDWKEISETEAAGLVELPYPRYYTYDSSGCAFFEVAGKGEKARSVFSTGEFDPFKWSWTSEDMERDVKNDVRKRLTKTQALALLGPAVKTQNVSSVLFTTVS